MLAGSPLDRVARLPILSATGAPSGKRAGARAVHGAPSSTGPRGELVRRGSPELMGAVSNMHWTDARPGGIVNPMRSTAEGGPAIEALATSREHVLETVAAHDTVLAHATAARMAAAHTLAPAPRDPAGHLEVAHARARGHLARLTVHDPARPIRAFMTEELFSRLTDAQPAPLTVPASVAPYTYTPRKSLRRVLDHALDHLNQIDQWLAWQRNGTVPTPTDGWVPSGVTLPEDRLPLAQADLDSWLWRIDQAARLVQQRAAGLTEAELDWLPPDGRWPLRRVLHHLARSERLYAAALDEALPEADAEVRYKEACRRLDHEVRGAVSRVPDPSIIYAGLYGVLQTPGEVVDLVLAIEGELLAAER